MSRATVFLLAWLFRHLGIPTILPVILTQPNTDTETLQLINMELEELELELDPVTVDCGCDASLAGLLHTVEGKVAASGLRRVTDSPLHFAVEQVGNIPRRGVFCAGRVLAGQVKVGDQLEAGYQGNVCRATVKDLEIYRRGAEWLQAGYQGNVCRATVKDLEI